MNLRVLKKTAIAAMLGLLAVVPLAGCVQNQAPAQTPIPAPPIELTVLHTNDVFGYVEPCG